MFYLSQPSHVLVRIVPPQLLEVSLGSEGIYPSVLDSYHFQKYERCNAYELLSRSMSCVKM
jgi:hypothetical protein